MKEKDFYNSPLASVYYDYAEDTNQSFSQMKEFFLLSKYIRNADKICEF